MAKTNALLTQEQMSELCMKLVRSYKFSPNFKTIASDLVDMQEKSKQLLASDSAYYPIIQDLMIYLETAQEAIDDAMKDINDLALEIKQ